MFMSPKVGRTVSATFRVLESTSMPVGSLASTLWQPERPAKFPGDTQELDRAVAFICKLFGKDDLAAAGATMAQILQAEDVTPGKQLIKGMVIDCEVAAMTGKDGKPWFERTWTHVPQTKQQIAEQRARQEGTPATPSAPAAAPAPAPAASPAPAAAPAAAGPSLLDELGI